MHPFLRARSAFVAHLAAWLVLSYLPASLVASPGDGRFLLALAAAAPASLACGLATLPVYYLCRAVPLRPSQLGPVLRLHLALGAAWSAALWALLWLDALLVDLGATTELADAVEQRWAPLLALGAMLYLATVLFYTVVASDQQARASERRAAAASLRAQEAQLALLQAQIHPHFLFNSLHAVSALTIEDPRKARELCLQLAEFLRGSLAMGARGMVPLTEELALARAYLAIEQARLGERLTVMLEVSPAAGGIRVPALLLQPLVENAITHGIATCARGGILSLRAQVTPGTLILTVTNPFDPLAPARRRKGGTGLGLANVSRRIAACYQGATLETRRDADRFTSTVVLPLGGKELRHGEPTPELAQGADRR